MSKLDEILRSTIDPQSLHAAIELYTKFNVSVPNIAAQLNLNYRNLKYALKRAGIKIEKRGNGHTGLKRSAETKANISKAKTGKANYLKRGVKYTAQQRLNIIKSQIGFSNIDEFQDVDKFLLIKMWVVERNLPVKTEETVLAFIRHFYYDDRFNRIYQNWIANGKQSQYRPSIDHKVPVSRGGSATLDNLQALTWFENKTKGNMTEDEWFKFLDETGTTSKLFIR